MTESTLNLFIDHPDTQDIEDLAAELEITVDYYIMEFIVNEG